MSTPRHLAIIMDGNGRWASLRRKPRSFGHIKGTRVAKKIITECSRLGMQHLTLYAFSTENWFRPQAEVFLLMRILRRYLERETENLIKENIRLSVIGEVDRLTADVRVALDEAIQATAGCTGLNLVFAISYGSRQEIVRAAQALAQKAKDGVLDPSTIDEKTLAAELWSNGTPDPDLIIRTSGEKRLSNFLMWQAAYSEFWFTEALWPDFSREHLMQALKSFGQRERRYGRIQLIHEYVSGSAL